MRNVPINAAVTRSAAVRSPRRGLRIVCAGALTLALALACLLATGCGKKQEELPNVVIGTLATEDILPFWMAEQEGMFADAGLDATVQVFQSATELIAGIMSGEVDYAMTDPMVAASIFASGTDVRIEWITLGTTAKEGRFGIMTSADTGITSVEQLAGVPIAVGSNTILEYVMDTLLTQAGIPADKIVKEEVQKLPVRYQQMASGQSKAAALPAALLVLGEANGCVTVIDDTQGANISQSVMISRTAFLKDEGGAGTLEPLKDVWNEAAKTINGYKGKWLPLLMEKANLNESVADTYYIPDYPQCTLPTNEMINPILVWMKQKGYLTVGVGYNEETGEFSALVPVDDEATAAGKKA